MGWNASALTWNMESQKIGKYFEKTYMTHRDVNDQRTFIIWEILNALLNFTAGCVIWHIITSYSFS